LKKFGLGPPFMLCIKGAGVLATPFIVEKKGSRKCEIGDKIRWKYSCWFGRL